MRNQSLSAAKRLCACLALACCAPAQPAYVSQQYRAGDFRLVDARSAADVLVAPDDYPVARIAAGDLVEDIARVTGVRPRLKREITGLGRRAVIVGTLGRSQWIDGLVKAGKFPGERIRGQWETSLTAVVAAPFPGVEEALVIAGSDRRGTAYGVYELSQQMGVSPWYWWADVPARHRDAVIVRAGGYRQGPPAVKYRGIFLNDEDWGLRPWAGKTLDPALGAAASGGQGSGTGGRGKVALRVALVPAPELPRLKRRGSSR